MTNKKKYLIIAAACILSGVWFNHEEATGLEYAADVGNWDLYSDLYKDLYGMRPRW